MSETEETPYAQAKRLHAAGTSAEAIERTLMARGLTKEEAQIAARAARGDAGFSFAMPTDEPAPERRRAEPKLAAEPPASPPTHPCPTHAEWPVSGTCVRCGKFFCDRCLAQAGLTALPESKQCPECEARFPVAAAAGIGGWLILPALHIIIAPLGYLIVGGQFVVLMSRSGVAPPMVAALLLCAVMLGYCGYTAIEFFQKKKRAVGLMLGFYGLNVVTSFLSLALSDADAFTSITRSLVSSVVWGLYFVQSKRVAATFVN
ncbi:MAG: DUF2569 domain-containing protein [Myxococcota bacterium]